MSTRDKKIGVRSVSHGHERAGNTLSRQISQVFEVQALERRMYLSAAPETRHLPALHGTSDAVTVDLSAAANHAASTLRAGRNDRDPLADKHALHHGTRSSNATRNSAATRVQRHGLKPAANDHSQKPANKPRSHKLAAQHSTFVNPIYSMAVQRDGKIDVAGVPDGKGFGVTRFDATGQLDTSFGLNGVVTIKFSGAKAVANAVTVDYSGSAATNPNYGKIIVAGSQGGGYVVVRLNSNGTLDKTFGHKGKIGNLLSGAATAVTVLPGGQILVGGSSGTNPRVVRLNADGRKDMSFGKHGVYHGSLDQLLGRNVSGGVLHPSDCGGGCGGCGGCGGGGGPTYNSPSVTIFNGPTFSAVESNTSGISGSGSASDNNPNATWSGTVDYGDGSGAQGLSMSGSNFSLNHAYGEEGTYPITVTITDTNDNLQGTASATAVVTEPLPNVTVPSGTVVEGNTFTANGSFTDSDTDGATYSATVNYGDGTGTQSLALSGNNFALNHVYHQVGTFPVTVTVTGSSDNASFSNSGSNNISVSVPPAPAMVTGVAATPISGTEMVVSWVPGTGSSYGSPDTYIIQRSQDNGETFEQVGSVDYTHTLFLDTALTPSTTYTYRVISSNGGGQSAPPNYGTASTNISSGTTLSTDTSGFYKVTSVGSLTNHPNDGYTVTGSLSISNGNYMMAGSALGAMLQGVGGTLSVTQTGQAYTPGVSGALLPTSSGFEFDDAYGVAGTVISYNSGTVPVTVQQAPAAVLGPTVVYAGDTYSLKLTSPGVSGTVTSWTINWGDGSGNQSYGNVSSVTHTYATNPATPTITATCTTTSNSYTSPSISVQVLHPVPTLSMTGDGIASASHAYTLNLASSGAGGSTVSSWSVNWGDGSSAQTVSGGSASPTHTYANAGNYAISATATDGTGTYSADPVKVNVVTSSSAPVYLQAAVVGSGAADLSWSTPADPNSTFTIQQSTDGVNFTNVGTASAGAKSYSVTGLSASTNYTFRVNVSGQNSGASNTAAISTMSGTSIYSNDFEHGVGPEWSNRSTSTTPVGSNTFLGEFGNNAVTLSLASLPSHVGLSVSFDLYILRSWDGVDTTKWGPDQWKLTEDGNTLLYTSFSNHQIEVAGTNNGFQNYPASFGSSTQYGAMYGATQQNTLGYMWFRQDLNKMTEMDSVYHLTYNFAHSSSNIALVFQGLGLQALSDESWGLDNMKVVAQTGTATNLTATASPTLPGKTTGPITLRWTDDTEGATGFEIDHSTDGTHFTQLAVVPAGVTAYPTYTDNTVSPDTKYYYEVHALYGGASSTNSNIASATSAAPGSSYGDALDSVLIPVTAASQTQWWSNPVQSNIVLQSGIHYELVASGDFFLGGPYGRADAGYTYNSMTNAFVSNSFWPDHNNYGIGVNDVGYPTIEVNHTPYWGAYNSAHVYLIDIVGTGQKLTFNFHDNYYYDNVADDPQHPLQVQIYQHLPAGPTNLVASTPNSTSVQLTWTDNATDETGFRIERIAGNGSWPGVVQTVNAPSPGTGGAVTFTDTDNLTAGTTYTYRVFALTGTSYDPSSPSNLATAILGSFQPITFTSTPPGNIHLNPYSPVANLSSTTWKSGEVFVGVANNGLTQEAIERFNPDGTSAGPDLSYPGFANLANSPATSFPGGLAFDAKGDLFLPDLYGNKVGEFDPNGNFIGYLPTQLQNFDGPNMAAFDAVGDMYIGGEESGNVINEFPYGGPGLDGIYEFNPQGTLLERLIPGVRVDEMALMPDEHTMLYTSFDNTIHEVDTNTGTVLPAFTVVANTDYADEYAFNWPRALQTPIVTPNGTIAVLATLGKLPPQNTGTGATLHGSIVAFNAQGQQVNVSYVYNGNNVWQSLDLAPDGTSFWAGDIAGKSVVRFDIATGKVLGVIQAGTGISGTGIGISTVAVYGPNDSANPVSNNPPLVYQAVANDPNGNAVRYSLVGATNGATIDPYTGVMTWPVSTIDGTYSFAILATDTVDTWIQKTQSFNVTVDHKVGADTPPVITTPQSQFSSEPAQVGHWYTNRVQATDADGDRLTYSLVNTPNMTVDPVSGTIRWLPGVPDVNVGSRSITVRVDDGRGGVVQQTYTVTVQSHTESSPPYFQPQAIPTATVGQPFTQNGVAFNVFGRGGTGGLQYIPVAFPDGMSMTLSGSGAGNIYWTPTAKQVGQQSFTVGILDGNHTYVQQTFNVTVLSAIGLTEITALELSPTTFKLSVSTTDPNFLAGATYQWGVSGASSQILKTDSLDVNNSSYLFTFSSAATCTITLYATDSQGTTTYSNLFQLAVLPLPTQIVVSPPVANLATNQGTVNLQATVYDQFGKVMPATTALQWSVVGNNPQNTVSGGSNGAAVYTAKSGSGTDVVQVTASGTDANNNNNPVSAIGSAQIALGSTTKFFGEANTGYLVNENSTVRYDGSSGDPPPLMTFADPSNTSNNLSIYTVTVDWGDGSTDTSAGVQVLPSGLFAVTDFHNYPYAGTYSFSVKVKNNSTGQTIQAGPPLGQGITAEALPVTVLPVVVQAMAQQVFNGPVADFVDKYGMGLGAAGYSAVINWGDGTSSAGTISPMPGLTIGDQTGGFTVTGRHTYLQPGAPTQPTVSIYEVNPTNSTTTLKMTAPLDILVLKNTLEPPTGLVAVSGNTQINLYWNPVYLSPTQQANYILIRSDSAGNTITIPATSGTDIVGNAFTDNSQNDPTPPVAGRTYSYQVEAADGSFNYSLPSKSASSSLWTSAAPTGVTLGQLGNAVSVSWTVPNPPPNPAPLGWNIYRSDTPPVAPATTPAANTFVSLLQAGQVATAPPFWDQTAAAGTTYWYEVTAVTAPGQESAPSTPISIVPAPSTGMTVQSPAGGFQLVAGFGGTVGTTGRVELHWNPDPVAGLLGYDLYRSTLPTFPFNASTLVGSPADPRYTDDFPNTSTNVTYYYAVEAVAADPMGNEVHSAPSNIVMLTTTTPTSATPPTAPTLQTPVLNSDSSVSLTWTDNSNDQPGSWNNELGFDIQRSDNNGPWVTVGRVTQDVTSYTDKNPINPGSTVQYRVGAYVATSAPGAQSTTLLFSYSNVPSVSIPAIGTQPNPPAVNTPVLGNNQINLSWSPSTGNPGSITLAGYYVFRRYYDPTVASTDQTLSMTWQRVTPTPITATSYTDIGVAQGATYAYRVTAVTTGFAQSNPSEVDNLVAPIAAPTATITSPSSFGGINVSFGGQTVGGDGESAGGFVGATAEDGRIQSLTPVSAIVDGPSTLTWALSIQPMNQGSAVTTAPTVIASGTGPVGAARNPVDGTLLSTGGAPIYQLDPTMFQTGTYQLTLTALDSSGSVSSSITVSLYSQTKLGNLTLPVTDLTVNVPNGSPITIGRTYDSQNANSLEDFGYGWRLNISDVALSTTATNASGTYPTPNGDNGETLRAGDVVYLTLPNGEQHAFQFFPVPTDYNGQFGSPYGGLGLYTEYWSQFVCVDGSNATLSVAGDVHAPGDQRFNLSYDPETKEFYLGGTNASDNLDAGGDSTFDVSQTEAYNPASVTFGGYYEVKTVDGNTYHVNAQSGQLAWSKDPNGNQTTYNFSNGTSANVAVSELGYTVSIDRNPNGTISQIIVNEPGGVQKQIQYNYPAANTIPLLQYVTDPSGAQTHYTYDTHADTTTQGNWSGVYGSSGSWVFPNAANVSQSVATVSTTPANTYSSTSSFSVNINPAVATMQVALYMVDANNTSGTPRVQTVQLVDATTKAILDSRTVSNFQNGQWLVWNIYGDVTIVITRVSGPDCGASVLALDPLTANNHLLTAATKSATGAAPAVSLVAQYDSQQHLTLLEDGNGNALPFNSPGSDGSQGSQDVVEPATSATSGNNDVQTIYDAHGDAVRTIQPLRDSSGNLTGYSVTVHQYNYLNGDVTADIFNIFQPASYSGTAGGMSTQNVLLSDVTYAPFVVSGADASGLRFADPPVTMVSRTDYNVTPSINGSNSGLNYPSRQIQYLANGEAKVTTFQNYDAHGHATSTRTDLYNVDGNGTPTGAAINTSAISTASSSYDGNGNLLTSTDATGQTTSYAYNPAFQLVSTSVQNAGGSKTLSSTSYYSSGDNPPDNPAIGQILGMASSTTDAAGKTTYYLYTPDGQVSMSYYTYTVGGQARWAVTTTTYDGDDRAVGTSFCVYQGSTLNFTTNTPGYPNITNTPDPRYVLNGVTKPVTTSTTYDANGHVATSTDQFGLVTHNLYDADGNVIQTVTSPSSEPLTTQSVYDSLGRVVWQTDKFSQTYATANSYQNVIATHTVYDALGRVIETDRYQGTQITVTPATFGADTGVGTSVLAGMGTLVSSTLTYYDDQGRVLETDSNVRPSASPALAGALRTGTIYYPNGQVQYSGPLNSTAPVGGRTSTPNPTTGIVTIAFQQSDFQYTTNYQYDLYDNSTGNPTSGLEYSQTTDPNNNVTKSYVDSMGRAVRTVYQDGSFTETVYTTNGVVPTKDAEGDNLQFATAQGWPGTGTNSATLPAGDSVTIQIAQRKTGDSPVYTISLTNVAGQLTDEWQPAVIDADSNSPTHGQSIQPHWNYTYDSLGNETSQTDPRGKVTTWTYDEQGNKLSRTLPEGQTGGSLAGNQTESWTYNKYNQVVTYNDFNGNMTYYAYAGDAAHLNQPQLDGREIGEYRYAHSTTSPVVPFSVPPNGINPDSPPNGDPNYNESTLYKYDDDNTEAMRGTTTTQAAATELLDLGRVMEVQDWTKSGSTLTETTWTHTTYDLTTGQDATISSPEGTLNYFYDSVTGREVVMYTLGTGSNASIVGNDTGYAYDAQGRLTNVYSFVFNAATPYATYNGIDPNSGNALFTGGTPLTVRYTYDNDGNLKTDTQPSGLTTTYTYNSFNELTDLVTTNSSNTNVFNEHYDLNNNGQRKDVIDTRYNADGSTFSKTTVNWQYDAINRLTDETLTVQSGGSNAPSQYHDHFAFDLSGNRVEEEVDPTNSGMYNQKIVYANNGDNQLTLEETDNFVAGNNNPVTTSTSLQYQTNYTYDNNGSLKTQVRTGSGAQNDSYGYDLRNRMTSATINGQTATYAYDSDGVRVSETTGGNTTYYLNDPQNKTGYTKAVQESATAGATPARSYLIGLAVEAQAGIAVGTSSGPTGPLVLLHDGHGSTRVLIDLSGNVQERYNYDATGNLLVSTGAQSNATAALTSWQYGDGGLLDPATGFNYGLSRWREGPRWTQLDPRFAAPGDLANANLVIYVGGNPVNLTDPRGLFGLAETLVAGGIQSMLANIEGGVGQYAMNYIKDGGFHWQTLAWTIGPIVGALAIGAVLSILPGTISNIFGDIAGPLAEDEQAAAAALVRNNEASEAAANTVSRFASDVDVISNVEGAGADLLGVTSDTGNSFNVTAREVTQLNSEFSETALIGKVRDEMYQFDNIPEQTLNGVTKPVDVTRRQVAILTRGVSRQTAQAAINANKVAWAGEPYKSVEVIIVDQDSGITIGYGTWAKS